MSQADTPPAIRARLCDDPGPAHELGGPVRGELVTPDSNACGHDPVIVCGRSGRPDTAERRWGRPLFKGRVDPQGRQLQMAAMGSLLVVSMDPAIHISDSSACR